MTLATSGADHFKDTSNSTDATPAVKTAFDCDILTLTRDANARAKGARTKAADQYDPLDALYKPLGNKDVACVLKAVGR